jgi:hypothetical protein
MADGEWRNDNRMTVRLVHAFASFTLGHFSLLNLQCVIGHLALNIGH